MTATHSEEKKPLKHKKLIITLSVISAVIIALISAWFIIIKVGEIKLKARLTDNRPRLSDKSIDDIPTDADAFWGGKAYYYNKDLVNILIIGVDKNNPEVDKKRQADVLYLVSLDTVKNNATAVAISRNTLAEIDIYDQNGEFLSTDKQQICLSYVYGNDDKTSSELTVKAVSKLLYGVPINGYYTIFMDSVKDIVNAVGGVTVTVPEDMTSVSPEMKKGATVKINGDKALRYLKFRGELNAPRFERQKSFVNSFVSSAKTAIGNDLTLPFKMYNKLAANTVTDVGATSAVYLALEAAESKYTLKSVEGTVGNDGFFETLEVDEKALQALMIDVFYHE